MKRARALLLLVLGAAAPMVAMGDEPLSFRLGMVWRHARSEPFRPLTEGGELASGDQYKIIFTPEEEAWVYVFQVDAQGQVARLHPMESHGGVQLGNRNPVPAGETRHLPAEGKAFRLDDHAGDERIHFLAFRAPRPEFDAIEAGRPESELRHLFKRRGITVTPSAGGTSISWQQDGLTQEALEQKLEGLCAECVHTLSFRHR